MGTGSSRARKTRSWHCSPHCHRSWSGSLWGSSGSGNSSSSAPACRESPAPRRSPAPQEPDSDSLLLEAVLEEFDGEKVPPLSPPSPGERGEGDGLRFNPQILLSESTTESNDFVNELPLKKPEQQAPISYDYSEEELMARIEQEYCR